MARHTEVMLLLLLAITAITSADTEKRLSEDYFDRLIKEAMMPRPRGNCQACCPLGWARFNGRCYIYHGTRMDWASAENHCLKFGANLVSIHSENEYRMAKCLVRAYDSVQNPTWLGLSNCQKRNNWFWNDGTKLTFTKWNRNEPNFNNRECCVHMNFGGQKDWNDIPCDHSYAFVCAKRIH